MSVCATQKDAREYAKEDGQTKRTAESLRAQKSANNLQTSLKNKIIDRLLRKGSSKNGNPGTSVLDRIVYALENDPGYTEESYDDPLQKHVLRISGRFKPRFTSNYCSSMGHMFEIITTEIFSMTKKRETDWSHIEQRIPADHRERSKKWKTDLLAREESDKGVRETGIELKYRYNSGQGIGEQARAASILGAAGVEAILYTMRGDGGRIGQLQNGGWTVIIGEDALEDITSRTGVNIVSLMKSIGRDSRVKDRIDSALENRSFLEKERLIKSMADDIANDGGAMSELIDKICNAKDARKIKAILKKTAHTSGTTRKKSAYPEMAHSRGHTMRAKRSIKSSTGNPDNAITSTAA